MVPPPREVARPKIPRNPSENLPSVSCRIAVNYGRFSRYKMPPQSGFTMWPFVGGEPLANQTAWHPPNNMMLRKTYPTNAYQAIFYVSDFNLAIEHVIFMLNPIKHDTSMTSCFKGERFRNSNWTGSVSHSRFSSKIRIEGAYFHAGNRHCHPEKSTHEPLLRQKFTQEFLTDLLKKVPLIKGFKHHLSNSRNDGNI